MNTVDDGDEVGALLRSGYAADVDPGFAASLLARTKKKLAPRPRYARIGWAAIAAGVIILVAIAAILPSRHTEPLVSTAASVPMDRSGQLVVCGRMVKWDAPIMEFAVSQVACGKLDAKTVQVDLTPELDAMHDRVREQIGGMAATESMRSEVPRIAQTALVALLNSAAGKDMVLELGQVSDGLRPKTKGRVRSWGSVTELPPRDCVNNEKDTVLTIVVDGSTCASPTIRSRWLTDEWGMPR